MKTLGLFSDSVAKRCVQWTVDKGVHVLKKVVDGNIKDMLFTHDFNSARESFFSLINYDTF